MFSEIKEEEFFDINGGALGGAVGGYVVGLAVGIGVGVYQASRGAKCGDSVAVQKDLFTSAVANYTAYGTALGGVFVPF